MFSDAILSWCNTYRYCLIRRRDDTMNDLNRILLNPSTADAHQDDPTIRKVIQFSKQFGYWWCKVYNLFALRSTDPSQLKIHKNPIGSENDKYLQSIPYDQKIMFAWWNHWSLYDRSKKVIEMMKDYNIWYLDLNNSWEPKHPLYVSYDAKIIDRKNQ